MCEGFGPPCQQSVTEIVTHDLVPTLSPQSSHVPHTPCAGNGPAEGLLHLQLRLRLNKQFSQKLSFSYSILLCEKTITCLISIRFKNCQVMYKYSLPCLLQASVGLQSIRRVQVQLQLHYEAVPSISLYPGFHNSTLQLPSPFFLLPVSFPGAPLSSHSVRLQIPPLYR